MKTLKIFSYLILLSIIASCSSDRSIEPENRAEGNVSLNFNKTSVPENVVIIKATLTQDNTDPIIGELNLLGNNSAELYIDNIPVGDWNLLIEASDSSHTVLFRGETIITVTAGEVTNVSLILHPTGQGTGSVIIRANWETSQWFDYPLNPVLEKEGTLYDTYGLRGAYILEVNSIYYMWYFTLADNGKAYINMATSENGIVWQNFLNNPVLSPGTSGTWDDRSVTAPVVIYTDNEFRMYYQGFQNSYGQWSIGLATSVDGMVWEKHPTPVLSGSTSAGNYRLSPNDIIKVDGNYHLYYGGQNNYDHKIYLANSPDGVTWTPQGQINFNSPQSWEASYIGKVSIIKEQNSYKMIYMSTESGVVYGFGESFSQDGINWVKNPSNPVFIKEMTTNNYYHFADPFYFKNDEEYRIYYSGFDGNISSLNVARNFY